MDPRAIVGENGTQGPNVQSRELAKTGDIPQECTGNPALQTSAYTWILRTVSFVPVAEKLIQVLLN